jgi:hypothetical protein
MTKSRLWPIIIFELWRKKYLTYFFSAGWFDKIETWQNGILTATMRLFAISLVTEGIF